MAADPTGHRRLPGDERHAVQPAALLWHLRPRRRRAATLVDLLLWALATPCMLVLGGPLFREAWDAALERRLTAATLISLGAAAAYAYSTFAVLTGAPDVYFDTATMLLLLYTVGRYLEAAGRARAMRDLAPMLAVGPGASDRPRRRHRDASPGARGDRRHAGAGPAGRAPGRGRLRRRGLLPCRRGRDHGREPARRQAAG